MTYSRDSESMLEGRVAQIDALVSLQIREIVHHPEFQQLEATWRGLQLLVNRTRHSDLLKIKMLNATKKDLLRDLRSSAPDETDIFKKIYHNELALSDGEPFSLLLGDYYFGTAPEDFEILMQMSHVAARVFAPFVTAAGPDLFRLGSFSELHRPRHLWKIFDSVEYARWRSFRNALDSRYIGLVLPRVLLRSPFSATGALTGEFQLEENVSGNDLYEYLWGNPVYALGERFASACDRHRWPVSFFGAETGGVVSELATHKFVADEGDITQRGPTETAIGESLEAELAWLGFIPLCERKGTNQAVFYDVPSCHEPLRTGDERNDRAARTATQLPAILALSRVCHYIMAMWRDNVDTTTSQAGFEALLQSWIQSYVTPDDTAGIDAIARRPLRYASVQVEQMVGDRLTVRVAVRPHFQLRCPAQPLEAQVVLQCTPMRSVAFESGS